MIILGIIFLIIIIVWAVCAVEMSYNNLVFKRNLLEAQNQRIIEEREKSEEL